MVATDKTRFKVAFNRLAVATRLPADQADAASQRIYFDGLEDLPIESIETAARELEVKAEWFPKVSEWRKACRRARRDEIRHELPSPRQRVLSGEVQPVQSVAVKDLADAMTDYHAMRKAGVSRDDAVKGLEGLLRVLMPMSRAEPWHYDCEACLDTGFELRTCYPESGHCGMPKCRGAREHPYTVRCACWSTNRTLQRMRERTFGTAASA